MNGQSFFFSNSLSKFNKLMRIVSVGSSGFGARPSGFGNQGGGSSSGFGSSSSTFGYNPASGDKDSKREWGKVDLYKFQMRNNEENTRHLGASL